MMKKVLIGLIAAAAMTSCIKREDSIATDQDSNLGTGTITGSILVKTDYVGDTLPNGNDESFNEAGVSGWEGVSVVATWSTNNLDPDNINGETMSTSTTTDADGNYTLTIDATGQGTNVAVQLDGTASVDVLHDDAGRCETDTNGVVIPQTESLRFELNTSYNATVRAGQTETRSRQVYEAEVL